MTAQDRIELLTAMGEEFESPKTSDDRRIELLITLRNFAEEEMPESKCVYCHQTGFHAPYTEALIEGHCYSPAGVSEYAMITKVCEYCFDKLFPPGPGEE